jgi:hypothetical protein
LTEGPAPRSGERGRVPLLITAELPGDILEWADALRRAHYPPERNRLRAHVTLFHALPPSAEPEIRTLLAELAAGPPPEARITGLMKLGEGTTLAVDSPRTVALHGVIAERLHGLLARQHAGPLRLHITVQAKVTLEAARRLQAELGPQITPRRFRFKGLGLYGWHDGLWNPVREYRFRGGPPAKG